MADQARTIRIPVHMVEVINKLARVQRQMLQDLGREPTPEELAKELDMTLRRSSKFRNMAASQSHCTHRWVKTEIANSVISLRTRSDRSQRCSQLHPLLQEQLESVPTLRPSARRVLSACGLA